MGNSQSLTTTTTSGVPSSGKNNDAALNQNSKRYGGFRKTRHGGGSGDRSADRGSSCVVVPVPSAADRPRQHHHQLDDGEGRSLEYDGHHHHHRPRRCRDGGRSEMIPDGTLYDSTGQHYNRNSSEQKDCEPAQLITARKPPNPNKQNPDLRELQRELAFNNKMGINVLGQKSELQKAMEKMRHQVFKKQLDEDKKNNRSDLERQLEKRALRLKEYENVMTDQPVVVDSSSCPAAMHQQQGNEFHRIHAKVNGRFASATS